MNLRYYETDLAVKAVADDGTFEGHGAAFHNTDAYGERILPGAFASSLKAIGSRCVMLFNHDRDQPIGHWEGLHEDQKGLRGRGVLDLNVARAREIHSLIRKDVIKGLSIGYRLLKSKMADDGVLDLLEIELKEISAVVFPANVAATITAKSEIETILRAGGLSRRAAAAIAEDGFKALSKRPDDQPDPAAIANLMKALDASSNQLKRSTQATRDSIFL